MKWSRASEYALVSDCGMYSVAKIGTENGRIYETWRTRKHPDGPHLVAVNLATSAEARKLAEQDRVSTG